MRLHDVNGYGLIAIDKAAGRILFLDPATLEIRKVIDDLPPKPHELLIIPSLGKAYVPIFGDGIHGDNPHPQHYIAVVDLRTRSLSSLMDISPSSSPHTARLGDNGLVYCCCEESASVVVLDPVQDRVIGNINVGSDKVHRLSTIPGHDYLITENEEDASLSKIALRGGGGSVVSTMQAPGSLNGIDVSLHHPWVIASSGESREFYVIDHEQMTLVKSLPLVGHNKPAQLVRYRQDGKVLVIIGDFDPVASFYDKDLNHLFTADVQDKPMDGTFTPDGRFCLVANEESGSISVISLEQKRKIDDIKVPEGCEVMGFYPLAESN